jgi:hypothetical protein
VRNIEEGENEREEEERRRYRDVVHEKRVG